MSSVLLTPPPDRHNSESDDSAFWSTMDNLESRKSNSIYFNGATQFLPFLNHSIHRNDAVVENSLKISVEMQKESSEKSNAVEKELEIIEPNVPFIDLENYKESFCINHGAIIKTEAEQQQSEDEFDYFETTNRNEEPKDVSQLACDKPEPHRASPPFILSIDGNIELEPLIPSTKTSKQIKINLTNSKVVVVAEPPVESPKTQDISSEFKQSKQKILPNEWETPAISYDVKESMKNATFHEQPICRRGWEQSGMCSIM